MKKRKEKNLIFSYFKKNILLVLALTITGLLFDGLSALIPIYQGGIISAFTVEGDVKSAVLKAVLLFLAVVIFVQINRLLKRLFVRLFANKITLSMRRSVFTAVIDRNTASEKERADLLNRSMSDVMNTVEGIRKVTTEVFDSLVLLISYFVSLFIIDYKVSFIVLAFSMLAIAISSLMKTPVYRAFGEYRKETSENRRLNVSLTENNLKYISNGTASNYYKRYCKEQDICEKKSIKALILTDGLKSIYYAVSLLSVFFAVYFLGKKVIADVSYIGIFTAYLSTVLLICSKVGKVSKMFNAYQKASVSYKRCKPLLVSSEIKKPLNGEKIKTTELILRNVECKISDDFTLKTDAITLKPSLIAVSGTVRSGKSAFIELLSGGLEYSGDITLCGINANELKNYFCEGMTACAYETPQLFAGTVKENILLGRVGNVKEALNVVCLDVDVDKNITHTDSTLSGGEKARLTIARAIIGKSKLILLDAVFSGLDEEMSLEILQNIKEYANDSIIIFTTNLSSLETAADCVLHAENGVISIKRPYIEVESQIKNETQSEVLPDER